MTNDEIATLVELGVINKAQVLRARDLLNSIAERLNGEVPTPTTAPSTKRGPGRPRKVKRTMSPEARERIRQAQIARWAKARKTTKGKGA